LPRGHEFDYSSSTPRLAEFDATASQIALFVTASTSAAPGPELTDCFVDVLDRRSAGFVASRVSFFLPPLFTFMKTGHRSVHHLFLISSNRSGRDGRIPMR